MGYTICVPYLWDLKRNYEGQFLIETFIDSRKLVFDSPSLSIAKFKGNSNDLDLYVDFLSKEELLPEEFSVVSRGESDFLNYDSYYTHVRSVTDAINEIEVITFILKGKEDSTFFTIMSSAPQDKDLNTNMAMLMNCSRQFELK
ncbi:MAG: hypothetical protein COA33_001085 [Fluviicola sp.]|nr:hypothetical protein [Fluviicola sp.]